MMLHVFSGFVCPGGLGERNLAAVPKIPANPRWQVSWVGDYQPAGDDNSTVVICPKSYTSPFSILVIVHIAAYLRNDMLDKL